jgi:glycosyltransferase involved in cell wall biosynthesis
MSDISQSAIRGDEDRILVFIPSFGDGDSALRVAGEVRTRLPDCTVLIIDDGSHSGRVAATDDAHILTVRLADNFGLGVCTHVAIDHMLRHGYSILVRIDADGQHPGEEIVNLIAPIIAGNADVVVGTRTNHADDGDVLRRAVKRYYNAVAAAVTHGRAPKDVNTGFFALNAEAGARIGGHLLERFPEPELFILACRVGLRLAEIGVAQQARETGRSTLTVFHAARMFYRFNMFVLNELIRAGGR